jgi:hypothetical protein
VSAPSVRCFFLAGSTILARATSRACSRPRRPVLVTVPVTDTSVLWNVESAFTRVPWPLNSGYLKVFFLHLQDLPKGAPSAKAGTLF